MHWPHCIGHTNPANAVTIQCYHHPKRLAKCRIIFCTILQLGISALPGPRYQQRSDVLRYVEAEEAGEPQNSIHEARREEELGVVEER